MAMNLYLLTILAAIFCYCLAAIEDGSVLARVKWTKLDDGKSLQLTIIPVDGGPKPKTNYTAIAKVRGRREVKKSEELSDNASVIVDGKVRNDLKKRQEVKTRREPMRVTVKRDDGFNDSIPVIVDGEVRDDLRKRNLAYYVTPEKSSIAVETEHRAHRVRRFAEGEFFHRGRRYQITPSTRTRRGAFHIITEKRAARDPITGRILNRAKPLGRGRRQQEKKWGPYYIELAAFTDVSVFLHMSRRAKSASKEQVIKNIHHRVGHIIHGVDLAYRRMKLVDMSVWLRALYVSTEYATSYPITINALDKASLPKWNDVHPHKNCRADANKIRGNINNWIGKQKFNIDHTMAFTMYDLWDMKDNIDVVGQADYANMCGPEKWRSSVVEWGSFHVWATAAHELAHNLNVAHDGEDTSEMCDTKKYYLMTTDSVYHDRATINNGFRFSQCTENTIIQTMEKNKEDGRACLSNKVSAHVAGLGEHLRTHLPGQEYDLRQQCMIVYGDKSLPCVRTNDFNEICIILYCTNPASKSKGCENPGDFRAAMGTPCGHSMWCYEGKCIHNSRAKPYDPMVASKEWVQV